MKAYVFPGQGSQKKGMGKNLFNEFKNLVKKADSILGYSIEDLCINDPNNQLMQTQYTQPALFIVNALTYLKKKIESNEKIDFTAGHSLGEYNALFAAEVFDFETGLQLVQKRGELMSQASGGGMAAIIGLNQEKVKEILQKNNLNNIEIANYNSHSQIVISGLRNEIENAKLFFSKEKLVMFRMLQVSGAFHTSFMKKAQEKFQEFARKFQFLKLKIPVISNVNAKPYEYKKTKETLIKQITQPVRWSETIHYLLTHGNIEFEEIGPGTVLQQLIKRIRKESMHIY